MTPVKQTILDLQAGNCFAACVASILDLPLSEVPNFSVAGEKWWALSSAAWLGSRGLQYCGCLLPEESDRLPPPETPCILGVPSTLHPGALHAVVGVRCNGEWRVIHDPHPAAPFPHKDPVDAQWIEKVPEDGVAYTWSARDLDERGEPVWGPMTPTPPPGEERSEK